MFTSPFPHCASVKIWPEPLLVCVCLCTVYYVDVKQRLIGDDDFLFEVSICGNWKVLSFVCYISFLMPLWLKTLESGCGILKIGFYNLTES